MLVFTLSLDVKISYCESFLFIRSSSNPVLYEISSKLMDPANTLAYFTNEPLDR